MKTVAMMALCLAVAACSQMGMGRSGAGDGMSASASNANQWDGVVMAIEPLSAAGNDMGAMAGGGVAAAAAGGATSPRYRVTLRKDDGSTQAVQVDSLPGYHTGDRVMYKNGQLIQRQQQ